MTRFHATPDGNVPFTAEEESEADAGLAKWESEAADRQAAEVRKERNDKLEGSDWTQVIDAPVDRDAWAVYRQALRDISAQAGFPWTIDWPVAP